METNRLHNNEESEPDEQQPASNSWPQLAQALATMEETIRALVHTGDTAADSTDGKDVGAMPENMLEYHQATKHWQRAITSNVEQDLDTQHVAQTNQRHKAII